MNEQEASERRIAGGLNCVRPPAKKMKGRFAAGLKVVPLSAITISRSRKTRSAGVSASGGERLVSSLSACGKLIRGKKHGKPRAVYHTFYHR